MTLTLTAQARCGKAPVLKVDVATLGDASDALRAWIEAHGLGMSDCVWAAERGVGVVKDGRTVVAHVAYNGRVWALDGSEVRA